VGVMIKVNLNKQYTGVAEVGQVVGSNDDGKFGRCL
jgi:hypothetical protein